LATSAKASLSVCFECDAASRETRTGGARALFAAWRFSSSVQRAETARARAASVRLRVSHASRRLTLLAFVATSFSGLPSGWSIRKDQDVRRADGTIHVPVSRTG